MSSSTTTPYATATSDPSSGVGYGTAVNQSSTYLQSIIISLVALALILVISVIFLYYRKRRLRQYSAAEWPFPTTFRSNVRGGGGRSGETKAYGEKPEMWEVEVTDGERWDGTESANDGRKGSIGSLGSFTEEIENWKPLSALASNPIDDLKPRLATHSSSQTTPTISTSSLSSISAGSSVQVSLLIAMPSPPSYRSKSSTRRENEELPDVEIGFCCIEVDDADITTLSPQQKSVQSPSGMGDVREATGTRRLAEEMDPSSIMPATLTAVPDNAVR